MQQLLTPRLLPSPNPDPCPSLTQDVLERHDSPQDEHEADDQDLDIFEPPPVPILVKQQSTSKDISPSIQPLSPHPRKTRKPRPASLFIPPPHLSIPAPLSTTSLSAIPHPFPRLSVPSILSTTSLAATLTGPQGSLSTTSLLEGPRAYAYTPTTARVPGYESLRDDHGIVYEKRRSMVMDGLIRVGIAGDGDARQGRGIRGRVREIRERGREWLVGGGGGGGGWKA